MCVPWTDSFFTASVNWPIAGKLFWLYLRLRVKDLTSHRRTLTITSAVAVRGTLNGPTDDMGEQTVHPFLHTVQQLQFCSAVQRWDLQSNGIIREAGKAGRLVDRAQAMPSDADDEMWLTSCRAFHSFICLFVFFVADTFSRIWNCGDVWKCVCRQISFCLRFARNGKNE